MPTQVECTRRLTSPKVVLQLYSTIEVIRKQRQIANLQRVIRVMEKEYGYKPTEILQHIHNAVLDKLVVETITVGCKGSKVGVEQEGYWIPDREQLLSELAVDKHDWYCFRCHDAGLVVPCANCSLVYHPDCLTTLESKNIGPKWRCPWCKKQKQHSTKREKIELSRCLHFVATQQKESIPELQQRPTLEDFAYYDFLIHSHYDLTILQGDCQKCLFSSVDEFRAKVELIHHNYCVVFGENHKLSKLAKQAIGECEHDLVELRLCQNCFHLSNTKPVSDWFCKPCQPPHQVVWAKQRGFEYWPAKVIRVEDHRVDVRFFGKHHPRAWLGADAVREIAVSPAVLKVKKRPQWKQANEEMQEYIRQCECVLGQEEAAKIILYDSPFGIGKNETFLSNMMKGGKNGSRKTSEESDETKLVDHELEPDISLNSSESNVMKSSNSSLVLELNDIGTKLKTDSSVILEDSVISELACMENTHKRPHSISSEENALQPKKIKCSMTTANASTQTDVKFCDSKTQVNFEELCGRECSCKFRYGAILEKFKDYLIESNHLEQAKLMRAAMIKASCDQQQAEIDFKTKLEAHYKEKFDELEASYETKLKEAKTWKWCGLCGEKAELFCCQNNSYCSNACMGKHKKETETECTDQTECYSSVSPCHSSVV